ncbi:MAG: AAA family ATPase [Candidatus Aenigmarchaeota archaeon]|nr:AAA family ATPase [Candidatus Aenigmarchaeota archaeon]MDW8148974.1 AAA family ATPase [Candidatus Aenigmarchaeota archaeon]
MPTRKIAILSGKGGVGKTTLTSNLSYVLANMLEQKTLAVDANFSTPDLSLHSGIYFTKFNIVDVLKNSIKVEKAIVPTHLNFDLLPGSLTLSSLTSFDRIKNVLSELTGSYDFILLDCPAGLGREVKNVINSVNEAIVVTNPDLPSIVNALKSLKLCRDFGVEIDCVVVNRIKSSKYELARRKVSEMLDFEKIFFVPEDKNVPKSITNKLPVVKINPFSPASREFIKIGYDLAGLEYRIKSSVFDKILSYFKF